MLDSNCSQSYQVADGTTWSKDQIAASAPLRAGDGDATLNAPDGTVTLIAGAGNDVFNSGNGNDTFVYAQEHGNLTINNHPLWWWNSSNMTTLQLTDINSTNIDLSHVDIGLVLQSVELQVTLASPVSSMLEIRRVLIGSASLMERHGQGRISQRDHIHSGSALTADLVTERHDPARGRVHGGAEGSSARLRVPRVSGSRLPHAAAPSPILRPRRIEG